VTVGSRLSGYGPAAAYEFGDCVCSTLGVASTQCVYVAAKIQMASVKSCEHHFFAVSVNDTEDGSPVFGQHWHLLVCQKVTSGLLL